MFQHTYLRSQCYAPLLKSRTTTPTGTSIEIFRGGKHPFHCNPSATQHHFRVAQSEASTCFFWQASTEFGDGFKGRCIMRHTTAAVATTLYVFSQGCDTLSLFFGEHDVVCLSAHRDGGVAEPLDVLSPPPPIEPSPFTPRVRRLTSFVVKHFA